MSKPRNTISKKVILETLVHAGYAMSQPEIQDVNGDLCDRVTMYRILDRLVEEGSAHKVLSSTGITKYAACSGCDNVHDHRHDHVHFNCELCGKTTCIYQVVPEIKMPRKYKVRTLNVILSGICPACV
jgi:Fur family ferric uptake transcriptional regulator